MRTVEEIRAQISEIEETVKEMCRAGKSLKDQEVYDVWFKAFRLHFELSEALTNEKPTEPVGRKNSKHK